MSENQQLSKPKQEVQQNQKAPENAQNNSNGDKKQELSNQQINNQALGQQQNNHEQSMANQQQPSDNNQKVEKHDQKQQGSRSQIVKNNQSGQVLLNENLTNQQNKKQQNVQRQNNGQKPSKQQREQQNILQNAAQKENSNQQNNSSVNRLEAVFEAFDKNRDHQISAQEVQMLAKQLKVKLTKEDIREFIKAADTDHDKKISFQEFRRWWTANRISKKNKIVSLIKVQTNFLAKANSFSQKTTQKFKKEISESTDKLNIRIRLGKQNIQNRIEFETIFAGNKLENQKKRLKQIQLNVHDRHILFILQISSNNPQEGKKSFNERFEELKKRQSQNEVLHILEVQTKTLQNSFVVQFSAASLDHSFSQFIEYVNSSRQTHGNHVFGDLLIDIGFQAKIKGRQNQPFIQWLAQGFTFNLKAEGNAEYLQIFRSALQSELPHEYLSFLALFKSSNIDLKLKSPGSVNKFFQKLGILQLSQQTPSITQTLSSVRQIFKFLGFMHQDHKQLSFVSDIVEIASQISGNTKQMNLWVHLGSLMVRLGLSSDDIEGLTRMFLTNKQ